MSDFLKALFGTPQYVSRTDTTPDGRDSDPNDVLAFTDPDACDECARRGELQRLEHDIRCEVMRGGPWQPEELEHKSEIRQLLCEGLISHKGTYWFRSPHRTVYRAQRDGTFSVAGNIYRFRASDDLVFQCRIERDAARDDPGPLVIARSQSAAEASLCGTMSGAMKEMNR